MTIIKQKNNKVIVSFSTSPLIIEKLSDYIYQKSEINSRSEIINRAILDYIKKK